MFDIVKKPLAIVGIVAGASEAHMTKADGTPVTVYVDKSYNVVSIESR